MGPGSPASGSRDRRRIAVVHLIPVLPPPIRACDTDRCILSHTGDSPSSGHARAGPTPCSDRGRLSGPCGGRWQRDDDGAGVCSRAGTSSRGASSAGDTSPSRGHGRRGRGNSIEDACDTAHTRLAPIEPTATPVGSATPATRVRNTRTTPRAIHPSRRPTPSRTRRSEGISKGARLRLRSRATPAPGRAGALSTPHRPAPNARPERRRAQLLEGPAPDPGHGPGGASETTSNALQRRIAGPGHRNLFHTAPNPVYTLRSRPGPPVDARLRRARRPSLATARR